RAASNVFSSISSKTTLMFDAASSSQVIQTRIELAKTTTHNWIRTSAAAVTFDAAKRPDTSLARLRGAVATKFWTFRWEYYCQPCREYEWCGAKARGYMKR